MSTTTTITRRLSRPLAMLYSAAFLALAFVGTGLATTAVSTTQAEAGVFKKAKKGLKVGRKAARLLGKGARKLEKASRRMGKPGRVIGKLARGVRRGAHKADRGMRKASRGISRTQRGINRVVNRHCRGACGKVLRAGRKVKGALRRLEREAERKCRQFGQNSRGCRVARQALSLASPI